MYKKTICYKDYDGNPKKKDFYFHISEAEVTEMELSIDGGFSEYLKKIVKANDSRMIMKYFKKIILAAYGIRKENEEGECDRFMKSDEISRAFYESPAYSALLMEFMDSENHPTAASDFVKAVFPASIMRENSEKENA